MRLEPTISMLIAIRSIQRAKRDSDGYRIRKYITLKSILFIMFGNLKLVFRRYTNLYGIFMSANLTLYIYKITLLLVNIFANIFIQNVNIVKITLQDSMCRCLCSLTKVRTFAIVYIYVHRYVKKLNLNFKVASVLP